jgi:hypothetical protein
MLLGRKRKFRNIGKLLEIIRVSAGGVEGAPVMRHLIVGAADRLFQAHKLE